MAIYNKRAEFTLEQLEGHFQQRKSLVNIVYSIIRFLLIIVENLYVIPSYLILSWFILIPTSWLRSDLYSRLENYLYNSLLFIVSSWSLAAGLTVVETGDEFKHLIEEPENHYPDRESSNLPSIDHNEDACLISKKKLTTICNNNNNNNNHHITTKRYLDSNYRVVSSYVNGTVQINGLATKTKPDKLKGNGVISKSEAKKMNGFMAGDIASMESKRGENGVKHHEDQHEALKSENLKSSDDNNIISENNKHALILRPQNNGMNPTNLVTRETALASRIISEHSKQQNSLKNIQDKPRILLLCNHISTADVPLIMQSFSTLTNQSLMWVLDAQFKITNFGVVCSSHGDFFVDKNKFVDGSLREHVLKYPDRNLLVLFPEGGFLRKRLDGSNRYADRNGLPRTKYVTHPRFGAFKDLIDPSVGITHIVDATLIYDDIKNPISILDIALGNKKEPAILHYKLYKRSQINTTEEEWLKNIWLEKDKLLTKYYEGKKSEILRGLANTFRVATLDWFKTLSVHLFYLLVCYSAIFRLFNATSVTMLKARELYLSNI